MGNLSLRLYPEKLLFTLLDQYYQELDELDSKSCEIDSVKAFRKETMVTIKLIEQILVERFKNSAKPIKEIATLILNGEEHESTVYKHVFVERILNDQIGMVDVGLLEKIIDTLDVEDLYTIIEKKKDSIYADLANTRYQEMMFEVEKDVENALEKKKARDEIENKLDDIIQEKKEIAKAPYVESPFTDDDIISIEKFITHFLGIELIGCEICHNDLKMLESNDIQTVNNTFAKRNADYVYNHILLLVEDKFKKVRTYINPKYLPLKSSISKLEEERDEIGKNIGQNLVENFKEYNRKDKLCDSLKDIYDQREYEKELNSDKKLIKKIEGMDRNAKY